MMRGGATEQNAHRSHKPEGRRIEAGPRIHYHVHPYDVLSKRGLFYDGEPYEGLKAPGIAVVSGVNAAPTPE